VAYLKAPGHCDEEHELVDRLADTGTHIIGELQEDHDRVQGTKIPYDPGKTISKKHFQKGMVQRREEGSASEKIAI